LVLGTLSPPTDCLCCAIVSSTMTPMSSQVDVLRQVHFLWPREDPKYRVVVTLALVEGRVDVIGVEMWSANPDDLDEDWTDPSRWSHRAWSGERLDAVASISTTDLRLPLNEIRTAALSDTWRLANGLVRMQDVFRAGSGDVPEQVSALFDNALLDEGRARVEALQKAGNVPTLPGRPRYWTEERYREVARIYSVAMLDNRDPTEAVRMATPWGPITKSAAAKVIHNCRKLGKATGDPVGGDYLPPTGRGQRAGNVRIMQAERERRAVKRARRAKRTATTGRTRAKKARRQ
jgi:hypothetical protein